MDMHWGRSDTLHMEFITVSHDPKESVRFVQTSDVLRLTLKGHVGTNRAIMVDMLRNLLVAKTLILLANMWNRTLGPAPYSCSIYKSSPEH